MKLVLLANVAATWAMVGLIWFVQVVHYPLFDRVGDAECKVYAVEHQRLTTLVVAPLMFVELATSILLAIDTSRLVPRALAWPALAAVAVVWLSTGLLQVPCHQTLLNGFDRAAYLWLVRSNWIRTLAWTMRGVLVLGMLGVVVSKTSVIASSP